MMKMEFTCAGSARFAFLCFGIVVAFSVDILAQNGQQQVGNQATSQQKTARSQQQQTHAGQTLSGQLRPATGNTNGNTTQPKFQNTNGQNTQTPANLVSNSQPRQPQGFPLDANSQKFVDQLLNVWETRSGQIKRYQFEFERWIYSSQVCNWRDPANNKLTAAATARGSVRYQASDKGMYEVYRSWTFNGVEDKEENGKIVKKAKYTEINLNGKNPAREKWICDGKSIYEYDFEAKRIYETELPADMQGAGLRNSPIPFMFGIKADEMKERFWIRPVHSDNPNVFIIEAFPKKIADAQNYKKLVIALSREPYLPLQMEMYASNYDEKTNQSYTVFQFENRQVDGHLSGALQFTGNFVKPTLPDLGVQWKFQKRVAPNTSGNAQARTPQKSNSTQRK